MDVLLCGMFLIMSQVTTTIPTPPMTFFSCGASPTTTTVMVAPTSVTQATLGQLDVDLLPNLIPRGMTQ